MSETKLYETLAKVRDFHSGIAEAIDELVQTKSKQVLQEIKVENINWQMRTGERGDYERADVKDNQGNTDFDALVAELKDHDGKITIKPHFYWLFMDQQVVGRKETKFSK